MARPDIPGASGLDSADYDRILDLVAAVAEIDDPDQFAEIVADEIGTVVASDVTSLNDVDPTVASVRAVMSPRDFHIDPAVITALDELATQHPLIAYMSATGDGSAIKISDFWTPRHWRTSELYRRVYAPMGVQHQMAIALPAPQPAIVGLALNRFDDDFDFSERDRTALNRVRPHLAQSWRNARAHAQLRQLLAATASALHSDDTTVLLLSDPIYELSDGALTDLYRFHGRPSERTPLPTRVERWLDAQRAAQRRLVVGTGLDTLTRPLTVVRGERRLTVRYVPASTDHDEALLLRVTSTAKLPDELATLGLSPREAQVLTALTTGATNADIAARLHLAPATVKNHLEHIYRKLGAHGRVQATTIALTMLNPTEPE